MVKITTINILEQPRAIVAAILTKPWLAGATAFFIFSAVFGVWLVRFLSAPAAEVPPPVIQAPLFPEKIDTGILNDTRFKALQSFGVRPEPKFGQTHDIFAAPPAPPAGGQRPAR